MRAVGYRQLWAHLEGQYDLTEGVRRGIFATRQLAKRQLTWLRAETSVQWIDPCSHGALILWRRDLSQQFPEFGL